jgi:hypothetical protein
VSKKLPNLGLPFQAVIETRNFSFEYDHVETSPAEEILADMELDMSGEFLFVLTAMAVSSLSEIHSARSMFKVLWVSRCMPFEAVMITSQTLGIQVNRRESIEVEQRSPPCGTANPATDGRGLVHNCCK